MPKHPFKGLSESKPGTSEELQYSLNNSSALSNLSDASSAYTFSYPKNDTQASLDSGSAYEPYSTKKYPATTLRNAQHWAYPSPGPALPTSSGLYELEPTPHNPINRSHLKDDSAPRQRVSVAPHSSAIVPINVTPESISVNASVYDSSQSPYISAPSRSLQADSAIAYVKQSQQSGRSFKTETAYTDLSTANRESYTSRINPSASAPILQPGLAHKYDQPEVEVPHVRFRGLERTSESQRDASDRFQHSMIQDLEPLESSTREASVNRLALRQDLKRQVSLIGKMSRDVVRYEPEEEAKILKECSNELSDTSRLNERDRANSSSPTISSNVDIASVSEDSEEPSQLDINTLGSRVFSRVFRRLYVLGQQEVTARGESNGSIPKRKQVTQGGSSNSSTSKDGTGSTRGRKNQRQDDDHGGGERDKSNEPPQKKGKKSQSQCEGRSQFLACPYWKVDPERYWDCFMKKNDTIAHLKQHLTRRHTPKYYCQICYQTFTDFDLFDSHALERSCTRGPSAKLEGISQQQKNKLSLKSKGSVEQQWYAVWSILFPDLEPPATIYIYSTQSEDFCRIQEFAQREGVAIMLDELESNGLVVRPDASSQLLRSTVQSAMVSIFRSYSNRGELSSEAEEPILSQTAEPDHGVSLQQESNNEGQMGHGNHPTSCIDVHRMAEDGGNSDMIRRLNKPSGGTCSQLPATTSWLPIGVVRNDTEDELWGTAFLDNTAFGESSSGWNLPLNLESSDMLDLDALLRDVISTEA
ncbi:hypothetical protein FCOIX_9093 [Fusarium coicis]|nr:hypothetical protein FCOIX_9093 [Fusarium coicis]